MDKQTILVRITNDQEMDDIANDLVNKGIEIDRPNKNNIITKRAMLRSIRIPIGKDQLRYIMGYRADGCFYFNNDTANYVTRGHNKCKDYISIEKYIKDLEGEI